MFIKNFHNNKLAYYLSSLLIFSVCSCQDSDFYSIEDFPGIEKIDAHYHIFTGNNNSIEQARKDNFKLLSINTYYIDCEKVVQVHHWSKSLRWPYENPVSCFIFVWSPRRIFSFPLFSMIFASLAIDSLLTKHLPCSSKASMPTKTLLK